MTVIHRVTAIYRAVIYRFDCTSFCITESLSRFFCVALLIYPLYVLYKQLPLVRFVFSFSFFVVNSSEELAGGRNVN